MRQVCFILFAAALPSLAAEQWLRLTTPNFELYTSAGEKKGRAVILHFEQVRDFFLKASPVRNLSDVPVRIVEFGSEEEYKRYAINAGAIAFYMPGSARDFIVIDEPATVDFGVATHEYMHLIVRHSGLRLPVWLNEGWADVYSSLKPLKSEAAIGDLLPGRVAALNRDLWFDFASLTSVTTASPIYNEGNRTGIFYAESWALAHMLYLAPEYADNFGKFVSALNQGKTSDEACQAAWGKSGDQVLEDLRGYFKRKKLVGRVYQTRLAKDQLEPVVEPVSDFDARLTLAELSAATGKRAEAKKALEALEAERPGNPGVARSLGYVALQAQDKDAARQYYETAFERGETDARMCYSLAMLERAAGQKPDLVVAALERALKTRPGYTAATIELGQARIVRREFPAAIATLMSIPTVAPDRAAEVFCNLAYAYLENGELEPARANVETCRKWARGDNELNRVTQLTKIIEGRSKPAAGVHPGEKLRRATGAAKSLACPAPGAGSARLEILAGNDTLKFDIPDAAGVEMTRGGGSTAEMKCGPLGSFPVTVEYAPPVNDVATGIARRIDF